MVPSSGNDPEPLAFQASAQTFYATTANGATGASCTLDLVYTRDALCLPELLRRVALRDQVAQLAIDLLPARLAGAGLARLLGAATSAGAGAAVAIRRILVVTGATAPIAPADAVWLHRVLLSMVRIERLELSWPIRYGRQALNLVRLPIPPDPRVVQVRGLEPLRAYARHVLSVVRLPFRHTCVGADRESRTLTRLPSLRPERSASACSAISAWPSSVRYPIVGRSGRRSTRPGIKPVSPRSAGNHNFLLPFAWRGRIVTPEPVENPSRRRCCQTAPVSRLMTTWHRPRLASGDGGGGGTCTTRSPGYGPGELLLLYPASMGFWPCFRRRPPAGDHRQPRLASALITEEGHSYTPSTFVGRPCRESDGPVPNSRRATRRLSKRRLPQGSWWRRPGLHRRLGLMRPASVLLLHSASK